MLGKKAFDPLRHAWCMMEMIQSGELMILNNGLVHVRLSCRASIYPGINRALELLDDEDEDAVIFRR